MIYHILDRQFNSLTMIDTMANEGISVENDVHVVQLVNGTLLNTLTMDIKKNSGPRINDYDPNAPFETSLIKEACYVVFQDDNRNNICLSIQSIDNENEATRPISCEDLGMEFINGSATQFESKQSQHIDYYVQRELYDTGWEIGVNELGTDVKQLIDTKSDETPLSRLQKICEVFNCEMTFTVDFQNLKITKKKLNIYRKIGAETNKILYSGVDVITMQKSIDIDNIITAVEDMNQGFNSLDEGDGRFFTRRGESIIYDREANALYGRGNTATERYSGWLTGRYSSSHTASIDNYNELRKILEERSQPTFSATVDMLFSDSDFNVGDWLTFVDEDYNPALRLKARVLNKEIYRSDPRSNKVVIGNYELMKSLISSDLLAKQQQMNENKSSYQIKLLPDNGTVFIKGKAEIRTVVAKIYKDGEDVTDSIDAKDLLWFKIDNRGQHDISWENQYKDGAKSVLVSQISGMETASIRCVMTKFDNHFVSAIYFLNGLKEIAKKIIRMQTSETVTSIHISDTHYATDSIGRGDLENFGRSNNHIKNVAELTNFVDIDYIVLNGDVHDGSTANKNIALSNYKEAISTLGLSKCPYFISWGNHCNNSWGDNSTDSITKKTKNYQPREEQFDTHGKLKQIITNKEMYEVATRPSTIFNIKENSSDKLGYYYYDVPQKKQRVIILNTQDIPLELDTDGYAKYISINVSGYRQKQITWLYQTLKNTPSDVTVVIYQHYPFGKRYSGNQKYYPYNYEMIDGIINSFVTGGVYSRSYTDNSDFSASISCDFQGRKGKLAFLAHGHMHVDRVSKDTNGIINYSIGCSVSRPKKDQADRPLGQLQEDLWDVVILNTKNRHVDLLRFGAGSDRSFDY